MTDGALAHAMPATVFGLVSLLVGCSPPNRDRAGSEPPPEPRASAVAGDALPAEAASTGLDALVADGGALSVEANPEVAASERPPVYLLEGEPLEHDFSAGPLYFTSAFDGSQRFSMWLDTMRFARDLGARSGKPPRFTYFVNSCYYDLDVQGSGIGRARTWDEILVRRALTQQAINEGHEIADHGVRHLDGSHWTEAEWRKELGEFHQVLDVALFEPIRDDDGGFVFPRFEPLEGAGPGAAGAACVDDGDCEHASCVALTANVSVCAPPCNRFHPCPSGTVCGAPNFHEDTDVCLPRPALPVIYQGVTLFNAHGGPNRKHPSLKPYRAVGFRAPFLGYGDTLVRVLLELGYEYDASIVLPPGPPLHIGLRGEPGRLLELALMPHPDALTVPMDFNYDKLAATRERMAADYAQSLVSAYEDRRRPWNVGHHFALWRQGAYWKALQDTYEHAARGCPDASGAPKCPDVAFVTFRELARRLRSSVGAGWAAPVKAAPLPATPPAAIPVAP